MAGNFIKGGMVKVVNDNKVVIDSNEIIKKKLEELRSQMETMEDASEDNALDEFSEGIDPVQVAMLVSDDEGSANAQGDEGFEAGLAATVITDVNGSAADKEYSRIIEMANHEAEEIKNAAKEQGYNEGYSEGHSAGLADGKREIEDKLNAEYNQKANELETQFSEMEAGLKETYENSINNMEPMLVEKIMDIVKHVTGIELAGNKEVIVTILKNALENMENGKNYLIHVSPDDFENVKNSKAEIVKGTGLTEESFEIIEDNTVPPNGALIESAVGIFDCGLGSQLELLKKKLLLISYE